MSISARMLSSSAEDKHLAQEPSGTKAASLLPKGFAMHRILAPITEYVAIACENRCVFPATLRHRIREDLFRAVESVAVKAARSRREQ